ncbi:MAG: M23 family metallopeptidase [Rhodospirillaceae bacterium]|nr:M23 family metallopeptidase [Rhodospirillales bacterium]
MAQFNIRAIETVLAGTGLKVDSLIRRGGQGGPFVAAVPPVHEDVQRWDRLSRALRVLPLAAPLDGYAVSSGFGLRKDPLNRRRAMHTGIDLLAPLRSPVVATAPGRVVFAGRKGGYGRLVEIDHGLGVHTRYGHLAAIHVHAGQYLAVGQRLGLLGSTGRSTGPHLHYEVMVDGKARNPQLFLRAGIRLNGVP